MPRDAAHDTEAAIAAVAGEYRLSFPARMELAGVAARSETPAEVGRCGEFVEEELAVVPVFSRYENFHHIVKVEAYFSKASGGASRLISWYEITFLHCGQCTSDEGLALSTWLVNHFSRHALHVSLLCRQVGVGGHWGNDVSIFSPAQIWH